MVGRFREACCQARCTHRSGTPADSRLRGWRDVGSRQASPPVGRRLHRGSSQPVTSVPRRHLHRLRPRRRRTPGTTHRRPSSTQPTPRARPETHALTVVLYHGSTGGFAPASRSIVSARRSQNGAIELQRLAPRAVCRHMRPRERDEWHGEHPRTRGPRREPDRRRSSVHRVKDSKRHPRRSPGKD